MRTLVGVVAILTGCASPPPIATELALAASDDFGCRPTAPVTTLEIRAWGDFPAASQLPLIVPADGPFTLDPLPAEATLLTVIARGVGWEGTAWSLLPEERDVVQPALVLPLGSSCAVADREIRARSGAMVTSLPEGRVWVAGGEDGEEASRRIVSMRPGDPVARVEAGLLTPRTRGTATALSLGGETMVLVAGGAFAVDAAVADTFELYRMTEDGSERVAVGPVGAGPRERHGAVRLADGSVLLVGGGDGGQPLASAERLRISGDPDRPTVADERVGALQIARLEPAVLRHRDGAVTVVGGIDAEGRPVREVERYVDGAGQDETPGFVLLGRFEESRADAAYAPTLGGGVLRLGGRDDDGIWRDDVTLLLPDGTHHALPPLPAALEAPIARSLPDGRVLVEGVGDRGVTALLVDLAGSSVGLDATRAPRWLLGLPDGLLAALDGAGLSFRRLDLPPPFADPPRALFVAFPGDRAQVVEDAPGRWSTAGDRLVGTLAGARFDLPTLRFAAARVTVEGVGPLALVLTADGAPATEVRLDAGGLAYGDCVLEVPAAAERWSVEVEEDALVLAVDGARRRCGRAEGRVSLAIRALEAGAGVRQLGLERR